MECCCGAPCARLEHLEVYIPSRVVSLARKMPHTMVPNQQHQSYRFSLLRCLLSDVTIDGKKIKIWSSEGHGRLGRVYALTHPRHDLKVSKTGLEASNYSLLASHNIPCAHVIESRDVRVDDTTYSVTVMTRLDFTLTALLRAAGIANRKPGVCPWRCRTFWTCCGNQTLPTSISVRITSCSPGFGVMCSVCT